jgi:anti-anti-sigma regulatory factor
MVACLKRARQRDGELKLVLVRGGRPEQLLKLAALDRVFETFDDEQRALASFSD